MPIYAFHFGAESHHQLSSAPAVVRRLGTRQQFEVLAAEPEPPEGTAAPQHHSTRASRQQQPQNEIAYLWRQVMRLSYAKLWGVHDEQLPSEVVDLE